MKNAGRNFPNPRRGIAVETVVITLIVITVMLVALLVTGCMRPTLTEGTVIDKNYEPPRSWTTQERVCAWRDYSNDDYYNSCLVWTYETHDHYDPEDYQLTIEGSYEGKRVTDWITVDSRTYDKCIVGRRYPDCLPT